MIGIGLYKICCDSMLPSYRCGDYVITQKWFIESLKAGDIVVVKHQYLGTIVKRIYSIEKPDSFILMGDNKLQSTSSSAMGVIGREQILGKIYFHITAS